MQLHDIFKNKGFTLIELMVVVAVVAVIAAIAIPSYQQYSRKAALAMVQQEMLRLAEQLERHRGRNFTYRRFNPNFLYGKTGIITEVTLPLDATGTDIQYTVTLRDISQTTPRVLAEGPLSAGSVSNLGVGAVWSIRAERNENNRVMGTRAYNVLLTSRGTRCMTTLALSAVDNLNNYIGCDSNGNVGEKW